MIPVQVFLNALREEGRLLDIDLAAASFAGRMTGGDPAQMLLAALVSNAFSQGGDVALPFDAVGDRSALAAYWNKDEDDLPVGPSDWPPDPAAHPLFFSAGNTHAARGKNGFVPASPLVLSNGLLYLGRSFQSEVFLRDFLKSRTAAPVPGREKDIDFSAVTSLGLGVEQKAAVKAASCSDFLVVSGGPGTGKTTIVSVILALRGERAGEIMMCAPTGKAQARMKDALSRQLGNLLDADRRKELEGIPSSTIHRLLSWNPHTASFRYSQSNPLPYKLLIVDECSMIPLALMTSLLRAVSPGAAVIMLGDRHQLSSVEPGSVFGDFCDILRASGGGHFVELTESRRFPEGGEICRLKDAVNAGQCTEAWELLAHSPGKHVVLAPLPSVSGLDDFLRLRFDGSWIAADGNSPMYYYGEDTVEAAWERFERFRILTPFNAGPLGADMLNERARSILRLRPDTPQPGEAFLILENDSQTGVFNGDTGILWYAGADGKPIARSEAGKQDASRLLVFFPVGGEWHGVPPDALPAKAPAYAFTVHKSQGSDYDNVMLFLPAAQGKRRELLTREIIYTGLTRAKEKLVIAADEEVFRQAVEKRTDRVSGLRLNQD